MQISGVTSPGPAGFVYSEFSCACAATSFPLSKHTGGGDTAPAFSGLCVCLQLMWEVGLPLLSCEVFLPLPLSQAFLLLDAGRVPLLQPEPLRPGLACLFTVLGRTLLPTLQHLGHPTLFATCLYCSCCLLFIFSFFPGWRSFCPGGYAVLAQGCLWKYCVPLSSPCPHLPKPSGHG
jgi:hypothetical protein